MSNTAEVTREVERAVHLLGSEAKLGALCGVSQSAIWKAKRAGRVSAELALAIDRATRGQVRCNILRPDLFTAGDAPPAFPHTPPRKPSTLTATVTFDLVRIDGRAIGMEFLAPVIACLEELSGGQVVAAKWASSRLFDPTLTTPSS